VIGRYEPLQNPALVTVQEPRVFYWLKTGALPTDTVRSLLQRNGLWLKWSLMKRGKDEAAVAAEFEKWQMAQGERRQRDEARKVRRAEARRKKKSAGESPAATPAAPAAPAA
jgi:small subunit ribosomal protein S16